MKHARHKAYQSHYETSMSKVLRSEARRKILEKQAKKNKKRKLLPVVEDPSIHTKRTKSKSKRNPPHAHDEAAEHHAGFVIKLKGGAHVDDSRVFGRPTPRYLPSIPLPAPGEQLTASELRAYDRMAKSAERRFDMFIAGVWKDIAKKDVPKAFKQMDLSLKTKQSNARKTVQLAAKEARRWQARSTKASKEMQIKAKKAMREV